MKVIVISSSGDSENEPLIANKMFAAGLKSFHIRKPKWSTRRLRQYVDKIDPTFHHRLVIHSHHNLALYYNLKGIHLTKKHRKHSFASGIMLRLLKLKNKNLTISTSMSRLTSLAEGNGKYDYVFLSPVFDSLSGKYQSGFTESTLKTSINKTKYKVIARGGVDIYSIEKVMDIGFSGMALYTSLWKNSDPLDMFNKIMSRCKELRLEID